MYYKNTLILIILVSILVSCGPAPKVQINANKELIREFTMAINNADWPAFDSLLTDNFSRHSQASPIEVNSRAAFVKLQETFLESCPDQKITIEMMVAEGDKVAAYATYTGTQTGFFGNFPPKGRSMKSKFISIFRIENNRIAELWVEYDNLAMLTQLGHFPPGDKVTFK